MIATETLEEFYKIKTSHAPGYNQAAIGDFDVFAISDVISPQGAVTLKYARRDFYKICLLTGSHLFHYADKTIQIDKPSLIFFNPRTPYKWEALSNDYDGFFCLFRDAFFIEKLRDNMAELPMFTINGQPLYELNEKQTAYLTDIFKKMIAEMNGSYQLKHDLLVSYVTEMLHYTLKMKPSKITQSQSDARTRITMLFSELLEEQFPITLPGQRLIMRSAKDFAAQLFLHVNHLNNALKFSTGKTTTRLIAERVALEAKMMLKHTILNISEIGYALGFEDQAHFNNFFKKHTNVSPTKYRSNILEKLRIV